MIKFCVSNGSGCQEQFCWENEVDLNATSVKWPADNLPKAVKREACMHGRRNLAQMSSGPLDRFRCLECTNDGCWNIFEMLLHIGAPFPKGAK